MPAFAVWSHTSKYLVKKWKKAPKYSTMFLHKKIKEGKATTDKLSAGGGGGRGV